MTLLELNPRWCLPGRWDEPNGTQHFCGLDISLPRRGMGLTFECPIHRSHRLGVFFANPIDGLPAASDVKHLWQRSGDTFDVMTLAPSVDASEYKHTDGSVCWHGHIQNGEVR